MAVVFTYTPPKINGIAAIAALRDAAELAGAAVLLAKSQELVPVDTGALKASGTVMLGSDGAEVSYSATNAADGYNYAAKQHEDETLNHPHGGQAHYLLDPMHTEATAILAAMAAKVRI